MQGWTILSGIWMSVQYPLALITYAGGEPFQGLLRIEDLTNPVSLQIYRLTDDEVSFYGESIVPILFGEQFPHVTASKASQAPETSQSQVQKRRSRANTIANRSDRDSLKALAFAPPIRGDLLKPVISVSFECLEIDPSTSRDTLHLLIHSGSRGSSAESRSDEQKETIVTINIKPINNSLLEVLEEVIISSSKHY